VKNFEVARLFDRMADVLELKGDNPFRIRAYRRAARNIESVGDDVETLARTGGLVEIPGVGEDLAGKIAEYLRTGRVKDIDAAMRGVPPGVVALMNVPGVGPKMAKRLYAHEGVTTIERLEKLALAGKLRGREGIQAKTEANILKGIALVRAGQQRMALGRASPLGRELVHALERVAGVKQVALAGSARRMRETVGDLDILVTSDRPDLVMRAFAALPEVPDMLERGTTKASARHREGIQVDLRVTDPETFGAALLYFTGSRQHNIRLRDMATKQRQTDYVVVGAAPGAKLARARALGVPALDEDQLLALGG
jgi:DNA polymerase (family X)